MTSLRSTLIASIASIGLASAIPALAEQGHGHEHGKEQDHGKKEPHFKVAPPATVKDAWVLITGKIADAEKHLSESTVEPVHEIGEQLEAAVHTLQEKSDMVAAEKKANLTSALKQLDKAIDGLHHAAEENDAGHAKTELKKITLLLPLIEALYPAGVLK